MLSDDIRNAKKLLNEEKHDDDVTKFSRYTSTYLFSNENQTSYFYNKTYINNSILTVTASGDFALNYLLKGAKKITCFDVNRFSRYVTELKIAAIKALDEIEFLDYLTYENIKHKENNLFGKKYFEKIYKYLEGEIKKFWENIYDSIYSVPEIDHFLNSYFFRLCDFKIDLHSKVVRMKNPYLQDDNYKVLKKNLLNGYDIKFKECSITELLQFESQYDEINLSNILQYHEDICGLESLRKVKKFIKRLARNNLEENGMIVVDYLWGCSMRRNPYLKGKLEKYLLSLNSKNYFNVLEESAASFKYREGIINFYTSSKKKEEEILNLKDTRILYKKIK